MLIDNTMIEILKPYISELITAITVGVPTWYMARRKNNADATTAEIGNDSAIIKQYKEALGDLPLRYEEKFKALNELFDQKDLILKEEISFLKKERDLWKRKYNELMRVHKKYKIEHP